MQAAVARHCEKAGDSRTLRAAVLDELRRALGFDWYVWVVTDPRTAVGVDPLASIPDLRGLTRIIKLKYTTALNRWTGLDGPACLGSRAGESALWRQVQEPAGILDVASVVFRDGFGCWGFLDLWAAQPVEPADLALLKSLTEPLTTALRLRQAATLRHLPAAMSPGPGPAVLILDDDLTVIGRTAAAEGLLARLLPPSGGSSPVPAAAYNVAAQLLATEAGVDHGEPFGRVHVAQGHWVTLRASRIQPGGTIAVSLEPLTADDRIDLCVRAFGLTPRESAVAVEVAKGADTDLISRRLYITANTVQDHLKSIFVKTGVHSRRDLVPLLLGSEQ